jgi:hypothetical protein
VEAGGLIAPVLIVADRSGIHRGRDGLARTSHLQGGVLSSQVAVMFWRRPPIRFMRLLGVAMLMVMAIIAVVPEAPLPFPGSVSNQLVALGDVLGLGP